MAIEIVRPAFQRPVVVSARPKGYFEEIGLGFRQRPLPVIEPGFGLGGLRGLERAEARAEARHLRSQGVPSRLAQWEARKDAGLPTRLGGPFGPPPFGGGCCCKA